MIEEAVLAILSASSPLTGLVGDRITRGVRPQGDTFPCLVYTVTGIAPLDARNTMSRCELLLDAIALESDEALPPAEEARTAILSAIGDAEVPGSGVAVFEAIELSQASGEEVPEEGEDRGPAVWRVAIELHFRRV